MSTPLYKPKNDSKDSPEDNEFEATDPNSRLAQVTIYSFENILIIIIGLALLVMGAIMFVFSTAVPVAFVGIGLIISLHFHDSWLSHINNIIKTDSTSAKNTFVYNVNTWESLWNLFWTVVQFFVAFWNYILPVLYLMYEFVVNYLVDALLFILDPNSINVIREIIRSGMQFLTTATTSLPSFFGGVANTVNISGEPGYDPGQYFGENGYYTNGSPAISTATATRFFYLYSTLMNIIEGLPDDTFGEFVNFIADPVLKDLPAIFEIIANIASLISPGGFWANYLIGDLASLQLRSLLDASSCFGDKLYADIACMLQIIFSGAINKLGVMLGIGLIMTSGCQEFTRPTQCSRSGLGLPEFAISPELQREFQMATIFSSIFQPGQCDNIDCQYFVVDVFESMSNASAFNYSCAFWTYDPRIVYNCMLFVQSYSNINNTSPSMADPATLAQEICFVALAQNVNNCLLNGGTKTFQFDFNQAAATVCSNSSRTGGVSYDTCTCDFPAPLCNSTCCLKYANHVNQQVFAQIENRTCAEMTTYFPQNKAWCPLFNALNSSLTTTSPFPDNTYSSMWCAYFNIVVGNLCTFSAPFTRIRDLDIAAVLDTYIGTSCNNVVNQTGVCVPVNATVDQLAVDITLGPDYNSTIQLYLINDDTTFVEGAPIITDFYVGDSADVILSKTISKHFCEQYSQINKNNNLIMQSQPWTVNGAANVFCDNSILSADFDVSVTDTAFYKYTDVYGNPIPVTLDGLPSNWFPFTTMINPNFQYTVCTAPVGPNIAESQAYEACVERLRVNSYDLATQQIMTANDLLDVWALMANHTGALVDFNGGVFYLDPPLNLNYTIVPYTQLRDTAPSWRNNYTTPVDANSIDARNPVLPFPFISDTAVPPNPATRIILSIDQHSGKPAAPNHYATIRNMLRVAFPSYFRGKTKKEVAAETKTKMRVRDFGNLLHEYMYKAKAKEYADAGFDINDVDYFPKTKAYLRKLMQTSTNQDIQYIWTFFATNENQPAGGFTTSQYNSFLQSDVLALMQYIFDITFTNVLPSIYNNMFVFANAQRPPDYYGDFGSIENGTETAQNFGSSKPKCVNSVTKPYGCCHAGSTSYECCYGVTGCIPDLANFFFMGTTTNDNVVQRWSCSELQNFFKWWQYSLKLVITGFVEATRFFIGFVGLNTVLEQFIPKTTELVLPLNFFNCWLVNMQNLFIGIYVVFAIYVFILSQVITWFLIALSQFMANIQSDNNRRYAKYEQEMKDIENSSEFTMLRKVTKFNY